MDNGRHKASRGCVNFIYRANMSKSGADRVKNKKFCGAIGAFVSCTASALHDVGRMGPRNAQFHFGNRNAVPHTSSLATLAQ